MSQSGYTPILIYGSGTASNVPLAANLTSSALGAELALNYADGKLYFKNSSGVVTLLASSTATGGSFTSITDSGNLTFTGTGNRITGDFSNATVANRVLFQSSTTNGITVVGLIPNGTATSSGFSVYNNADPTNSSISSFNNTSTDTRILATISGTGTYLPMTFYTGGTERARIDTSGNVGIGTATANLSSSSTALTVNTGTAANFAAFELASAGTLNYYINANNAAVYHVAAGARPWIVSTNGSERMRIDSSGNVGIGTSSPSSPLNVVSASSSLAIAINGRSSDHLGAMYFYANNGSTQ